MAEAGPTEAEDVEEVEDDDVDNHVEIKIEIVQRMEQHHLRPEEPRRRYKQRPPDQNNYTKHFNNWNMCFSCGFDVPGWHTSTTCPTVCRKEGHQEGCNRQNHAQYAAQGHNVGMKGAHKNILPANPQAY